MRFSIFTLLFCFSLVSFSQERLNSSAIKREHIKSISLVAPVWKGYTNSDGSGIYWDIMRAIYEPLGLKVKTANIPWSRAMKMVSQYHSFNAIVGEYRDTEEALLFPDFPIDTDYMSVLIKNDTGNVFVDMSSLTGKKVGWIKDYNIIVESERDFELVEFRGLDQAVQLLNSGRVDFVMDVGEELEAHVNENALSLQEYTISEMPIGKAIYTAFSDNQISAELIKIYNERIPVLAKSGELAQIYKKWENAKMPEVLANITN